MNARYLPSRLRSHAHRVRRFILLQILHVDDPPHRLALGVAIGMFMTFTPTVGFQTALVLLFAWLLRANKVVGLPLVWITNPATVVPIYYFCYMIGRLLLGRPGINQQWWSELAQPRETWWATLTSFWSRLMEIAEPLWVGCLLVSSITAVLSYGIVYWLIQWFRAKRAAASPCP